MSSGNAQTATKKWDATRKNGAGRSRGGAAGSVSVAALVVAGAESVPGAGRASAVDGGNGALPPLCIMGPESVDWRTLREEGQAHTHTYTCTRRWEHNTSEEPSEHNASRHHAVRSRRHSGNTWRDGWIETRMWFLVKHTLTRTQTDGRLQSEPSTTESAESKRAHTNTHTKRQRRISRTPAKLPCKPRSGGGDPCSGAVRLRKQLGKTQLGVRWLRACTSKRTRIPGRQDVRYHHHHHRPALPQHAQHPPQHRCNTATTTLPNSRLQAPQNT